MASGVGLYSSTNIKGINSRLETGRIAIAIDNDKNSQAAVKWTLENLLTKKTPLFVVIHVNVVPSDPGDWDPKSKLGRPPNAKELQSYFHPLRGICARKGVKAVEIVVSGVDIATALAEYITNNSIDSIVIGASNRNLFTRKFKNADVPSGLLRLAPETCAVYVISKGKVLNNRPSKPQTPTSDDYASAQPSQSPGNSSASLPSYPPSYKSAPAASRQPSPVQGQSQKPASHAATYQAHHESLPYLVPDNPNSQNMPRYSSEWSDKSSDYSQWTNPSDESRFTNRNPRTSGEGYPTNHSAISSSSQYSNDMDYSYTSESTKSSRASNSSMVVQEMHEELRRLKLELKQSMDAYHSISKEAELTKKMTSEMQQLQNLEARKLEEARQSGEAGLSLLELEKKKAKAALQAVKEAKKQAELEIQRKKDAEMRAQLEAGEINETIAHCTATHRKYTIQDIERATDDFSDSNKIGEGGYGPVYKAVLDNTAVAIKVLRPDIAEGQRQFRQELEVLGKMRHPQMVVLLGSCPEYGCLVYEYMENGSLEDRLYRKDNTPSIPWRTRFEIAYEIATGLLFLHQTKPEPLVHRDLKPANILLDGNYVSKIADVGLARLVPASVADSVTQYHMTAAAGTFCYIDPEYQQSGMLGVKSDLYSFGVVLLQILTGRPPMGLSHHVEMAIEKGKFADMLDPTQKDWPVQAALEVAQLALRCCELRKKDRPDLATVVLPELMRLRDIALASGEDESEIALPPSFHSDPGFKPRQITGKPGQQKRLASMIKFQPSFKSSTKDDCILPPRGNMGARKCSGMEFYGCWSSFRSCASAPKVPLIKFRTFSG
ncbi:hypothetical protein Tsubulata_018464 [Turnera subulata]|uniref:RING-type E3 ubiquitin transferase n=1 Tax=Turnera subulata TaxID=218843 RepID=A0A9Q0JBT4_9ROSI|nr:hypothetical protein Tsubulata_018464 [Turnera subulata]